VGGPAGAARFGTGIPAADPHRSSECFHESRIRTVIIAAIKSNLALASAPGNVLLPRRVSRLRAESVINVSQLVALYRRFLTDHVGKLELGNATS
jgi:mRNA-degrading endonuclease toxin of MazEF toxin-antitoxin module